MRRDIGRLACLAIAILLTGCVQRYDRSSFEPTENGTFRYKASADIFSKAGDEDAERERMDWLKTWLAHNNYCQNGFAIDSRKPVRAVEGLFGDIVDIYYTGHCVDDPVRMR